MSEIASDGAAIAAPPKSNGTAIAAVLGSAALFGTTGTAQALGPSTSTPLGVGAIRLIVGGLGLLAVLPWLGVPRRQAFSLWRRPAGIAAGIMTAVYQVSFFAGVTYAGVALGAVVAIGTGPVIVGFLSWAVLGERPTRAWVVATAVSVTGLVAIAAGGGQTGDGGISAGRLLVGIGLVLVASAGYAVYTVFARRLILQGNDSAAVMASAFSLGGVMLLPVLVVAPMAWLWSGPGVALALWLGLATTTLAYILFGRGLATLPAGTVATLVLAEPVVATVLGVVVLGERPALPQWVGVVLVAVALVGFGIATGRAGRSGRA